MYVKAAPSEKQREAMREAGEKYRAWKQSRMEYQEACKKAWALRVTNSDLARAVGVSETAIKNMRRGLKK